MHINFKQPKYILPLILLPFLCLFFFVYRTGFAKQKGPAKHVAGLNSNVGEVAPDIQKKQLEDKLEAYRKTYKEGDGMTAVTALPNHSCPLSWMMMKSNFGLIPTPVQSRPP